MTPPTAGHAPVPDRWRSVLYNVVARTATLGERPPFKKTWKRWFRKLSRWHVPVATTIHGYPALVSSGYTYPVYARRYPSLNAPLIELVNQAHRALGRPLQMIDVGAAIGDTVLLLEANVPGAIAGYACIDGDAEFFGYLEHNLRQVPHARAVLRVLSSAQQTERALVRIHGGTASAQGDASVSAMPLDDVLAELGGGAFDLLKIDVDGFDGEVLAGARRLLATQRPAVIFEWHPILCEKAGKDPQLHFRALADAGYATFAWFDKLGTFSHIDPGYDAAAVARLADFCRTSTTHVDWHYDVVALPSGSAIDVRALAGLGFAAQRRSHF